jgi:hypothetical protein
VRKSVTERVEASLEATPSRARDTGLRLRVGGMFFLLGMMGMLAASALLFVNAVTYVADTAMRGR